MSPPCSPQAFLLFNTMQSRTMDRPGFTPTVETAGTIVKHSDYPTAIAMGSVFGPPILAIAGLFGFCALRKRLDRSIVEDETEIVQQEEETKKAEAVRLAVEVAEKERLDKLPPSVSIDRDIKVRQIKLKNGAAS
jgi:hypothetical protein